MLSFSYYYLVRLNPIISVLIKNNLCLLQFYIMDTRYVWLHLSKKLHMYFTQYGVHVSHDICNYPIWKFFHYIYETSAVWLHPKWCLPRQLREPYYRRWSKCTGLITIPEYHGADNALTRIFYPGCHWTNFILPN